MIENLPEHSGEISFIHTELKLDAAIVLNTYGRYMIRIAYEKKL